MRPGGRPAHLDAGLDRQQGERSEVNVARFEPTPLRLSQNLGNIDGDSNRAPG
jgi:hypothetical protein